MNLQTNADLEKLQNVTEKLLSLLKDHHPGLFTWNNFLQECIKEIKAITSQNLIPETGIPEKWLQLIDEGWIIKATSCECGGHWAWLKPRTSGTHEMHSCVCHNTPQ